MEYIKGQTLRQWMDENKEPDIKIVVSFVKQIIQGLRAEPKSINLICPISSIMMFSGLRSQCSIS
jgi:protein phosphatase